MNQYTRLDPRYERSLRCELRRSEEWRYRLWAMPFRPALSPFGSGQSALSRRIRAAIAIAIPFLVVSLIAFWLAAGRA